MWETHNMSHCLSAINIMLHDTILINSDGRKEVKGLFIAWFDSVEDQADDNFLPCRTSLVPELGLFQVHDILNILHDVVQGSSGKNFILIVVSNCDQHFGVSVVHGSAKVVSVLQSELIRVTSCRGIWSGRGQRSLRTRVMDAYIAYE